jgi:hypothetical protein
LWRVLAKCQKSPHLQVGEYVNITINPELKAALLEITEAEGISPDSFIGKAISAHCVLI